MRGQGCGFLREIPNFFPPPVFPDDVLAIIQQYRGVGHQVTACALKQTVLTKKTDTASTFHPVLVFFCFFVFFVC
jgi:hypothetical protein